MTGPRYRPGGSPASDALQHVVGHPVQLAGHRDAARLYLEHARVYVVDRVQPVARGGLACLQELGACEIRMQRQTAHQRAVHEQLDAHDVADFGASGDDRGFRLRLFGWPADRQEAGDNAMPT